MSNKDYELSNRALLRMAKIINAADTNRLDADPLAAGFEAIAVENTSASQAGMITGTLPLIVGVIVALIFLLIIG